MIKKVALFVLPITFLLACDGDVPLDETESDQFIGFEDYKRLHVKQLSDGSWLVESDILVEDEEGVRAYYDRLAAKACEDSDECLRAIVLQDGSADDEVWTPAEKMNLTYCISDMGSVSNYDRVKAMLKEGTREWETWADVNFIHLSAQDGSGCTAGSNGVRIKVSRLESCEGNYLAWADLPNDSTPGLRYCPAGLAADDATLRWVTKHELGHTLGLVHEHFNWSQNQATCQVGSDRPRRNVTWADPYSIMGYDYCNGTEGANNNKVLSHGDRVGIQRLYNIARGHGRLNGTAFNHANSFLSTGVSDDIFWHVPGSAQYQLWATLTSPAISFVKYLNSHPLRRRSTGDRWACNGSRMAMPITIARFCSTAPTQYPTAGSQI